MVHPSIDDHLNHPMIWKFPSNQYDLEISFQLICMLRSQYDLEISFQLISMLRSQNVLTGVAVRDWDGQYILRTKHTYMKVHFENEAYIY